MKKEKIVLLISVLVVVILLVLLSLKCFSSPKIVYVNNEKLFDGFNMTKEMKKTGQKEFNKKRKVLDSLYYLIESPSIEKNQKEQLLKVFIPLKEEFENFNQTFGQTESEKIWKRIDSYIKEFSKEKGYAVVLGTSTGDRTVLYSDSGIDVTPELITYINKHYEGKN